jgi:RNA polymerase sigma factor (sigma-70 family)
MNEDARLLERIRSGDADAGQQFVRDHYRAVYHYLLSLTKRPDLAEDLTQEAFLQAWRRLETFQGRGSLRGWLLRIAQIPLRDLMRQLSRPFGYTWIRSGEPRAESRERGAAAYRYELVQDMRSQLLEEELRDRDRNAAWLALEEEMQRYQPLLDLAPDVARARIDSAAPSERPLLEIMAEFRWGAIQLYHRLAPADLARLHAGEKLRFRGEPGPGELPLPSELTHGVLQSYRGRRIARQDGELTVVKEAKIPDAMLLTDVPEVRATVELFLDLQELGRFTLWGGTGIGFAPGVPSGSGDGCFSPLATATNPATRAPKNACENARLTRDRTLRRLVSVHPIPAADPRRGEQSESPFSPGESGPKVTTADVLEALHQATKRPIVADYTRCWTRSRHTTAPWSDACWLNLRLAPWPPSRCLQRAALRPASWSICWSGSSWSEASRRSGASTRPCSAATQMRLWSRKRRSTMSAPTC